MEIFVGILVLVAVVFAFWERNKKSKPPFDLPADKIQTSADTNNNQVTSKKELSKLTKVQLIDLAEKKNLKIKKSGSKAAVINEIHSQLK